MDILEKMASQQLYFSDDAELRKEQLACMENLYDFNHTRPSETETQKTLLKKIFAEYGENSHIEPPLRANWGKFTHIGNFVYANFNLMLVDDTDIFIGDYCLIGPNVIIDTGTHPICPELREQQVQFNVRIVIERNVWLGAGSIILPGVRIGENSVIGAGSVVTKDIPANVVAVGSPCRVVREINEHDREYYYKDLKINP